MNTSVVLLMTGTVDPGYYAQSIARNDVDLRTQDYLTAIKFWSRYPDSRIKGVVFCENSGVNVHAFEAAGVEFGAAREFQVLSYDGNATPPLGMHFGYNELGAIDHACLTSALLRKYRYFIKVTGRLIFPRLTSVIGSIDDDTLAMVDCVRARGGIPLTARTQMMFFEREFYEQVLLGKRVEMIGNCNYIEEFIPQKLLPLYQKQIPGIHLRFKVECPPVGFEAHVGKNYTSPHERLKIVIRSSLRRLLPSLWL